MNADWNTAYMRRFPLNRKNLCAFDAAAKSSGSVEFRAWLLSFSTKSPATMGLSRTLTAGSQLKPGSTRTSCARSAATGSPRRRSELSGTAGERPRVARLPALGI